MATIPETLEKILGVAPAGFEWVQYVASCFIVVVLFTCLMSLLRSIFDFVAGRRR